MPLASLRDFLAEIPAWERRFNRKYQIKTVLRMNDLLAKQGLTQKDVCERTGWNKGFVSRLLSGGGNLTLATLARFEEAVSADVLEVTKEPEAHTSGRLVASAMSAEAANDYAFALSDPGYQLRQMSTLLSSSYSKAAPAYAGE